jgi:hypothetical protein
MNKIFKYAESLQISGIHLARIGIVIVLLDRGLKLSVMKVGIVPFLPIAPL